MPVPATRRPKPTTSATPGQRSGQVETPAEAVDRLSLRQQVGQLTISSFEAGPLPDYVRRRLRAGETAGVILFGFNAATRGDWRRLTRAVQRPARGGALVMVDQEGGDVQAVAFAGPPVGQPLQGDPAAVRHGARAAARRLRDAGVNVNLAPVADVPGGAAPVMGSRAFAGTASDIAARTRASIEGMGAAEVGATAKHFPGLGRAQVNTDDGSTVVSGDLDADLVPFRAAIEARVPLVMLSHALYPAVDPRRIASQSPRNRRRPPARRARLRRRDRHRLASRLRRSSTARASRAPRSARSAPERT